MHLAAYAKQSRPRRAGHRAKTAIRCGRQRMHLREDSKTYERHGT